MASEGPNNPGSIVNDTAFGSEGWTDPGSANVSDNVYATAVPNIGGETNYLKADNFGFSIPAGATVDGITVDIERNGTQTDSFVQDARVRIVKSGTVGNTEKALGSQWPTSDATETYGGTSDLWGETWSADDMNLATFGVVLAGSSDAAGGETASVDHITMTVEYTGAVGGTQQASSDAFVNNVNIF